MIVHHRGAEARAFAQAVPQASAHLWGAKQAVYPQRMWSGWLYGGHQMAHRRQVLAQFARGWTRTASWRSAACSPAPGC